MLGLARGNLRLVDLAIVGLAVVVSVSLSDELGDVTALVLGLGVLLTTQLPLGRGSRS
jgi:hypothetical protein